MSAVHFHLIIEAFDCWGVNCSWFHELYSSTVGCSKLTSESMWHKLDVYYCILAFFSCDQLFMMVSKGHQGLLNICAYAKFVLQICGSNMLKLCHFQRRQQWGYYQFYCSGMILTHHLILSFSETHAFALSSKETATLLLTTLNLLQKFGRLQILPVGTS